MHAALMLALAGWLAAGATADAGPNMLNNGSFEGPYHRISIVKGQHTSVTGWLADGWRDNSDWARVTVRYEEIRDNPHGGARAQRMIVERIESGAAYLVQYSVELKKGVPYRASVYARSPDAIPMTLKIRQPGSPYTSYASRTYALGENWQECVVTFTSPVTGQAMFMLVPEDMGRLDVDDAALAPVDLSKASPRAGNLLPTGRLVGAVANGWAPVGAPNSAFRYHEPTAGEPEPYVEIEVGGRNRVSLCSPPVVVNATRRHTLSVDLKGDPPDMGVRLSVHGARSRWSSQGFSTTVRVTGQWKRYSASGLLPLVEASAFTVQISPLSSGTLCLRDVQLVEGEGPVEFRPAVPVEVAVLPQAAHGLHFDGEAARLSVLGAGRVPRGSRLRLSVHDVYGGVEQLPDRPLSAGHSFRLELSVPPPDRQRGMFRLEARVVDASGKVISNVGQGLFARVPRPRYPDRLMPDSPFGVHIPLDEDSARLAQSLGFKWCRIHDASWITTWSEAEPEKGKFVFFDDQVRMVRAHGILVLGMLDTSPAWASGAPENLGEYRRRYFVPHDIDAWARYCRTVVSHYKGLIDHWEVWNEPWAGGFFDKMDNGNRVKGTPEDYVRLLGIAYREAKKANPQAVVIGIDSAPPEWTEGCLKAGAAGKFDEFSFHQYTFLMPGGPDGALAGLARSHRRLLAGFGLKNVPVWQTEGGPEHVVDTFYVGLDPLASSDGTREAAWLARYYLATTANDVRGFFLYTLHSHRILGEYCWQRQEVAGYLKPWAPAVANLAYLITGLKLQRQISRPDGLVCLDFAGEGRRVCALFAVRGSVPAGKLAGLDAIDLYGNATRLNRIGMAPVYLVGKQAERAARALRE